MVILLEIDQMILQQVLHTAQENKMPDCMVMSTHFLPD